MKVSTYLAQLNIFTLVLPLPIAICSKMPSQHRDNSQSYRQHNQNPDVARDNRLALGGAPVEQRSREDGLKCAISQWHSCPLRVLKDGEFH